MPNPIIAIEKMNFSKPIFVFNEGGKTTICFPELGIHRSIFYNDGKVVKVEEPTICDKINETHKTGWLLFGNSEFIRQILIGLKKLE